MNRKTLYRVLLSWLPLTVLVATVPAAVSTLLAAAPDVIALLATTAVVISAMTWIVAPLVNSLLARLGFGHPEPLCEQI